MPLQGRNGARHAIESGSMHAAHHPIRISRRPMPTSGRIAGVLLGTTSILLLVAGCTVRPAEPGEVTAEPIWFSVELVVNGDPYANNPRRRKGRYLLEANRNLRAISGPTARTQTYPPYLRRVAHAEFLDIYRHVVEHELNAEPTSPNAEPATTETPLPETEPSIVYHVTLNVNGQWHRYATTAEESPPTVQLLARLIEASVSVPGSAWASRH